MLKELGLNFSLLLGSLAVCLFLAELAFRLFETRLMAKPEWSDRPAWYYWPKDSSNDSDYSYQRTKQPGTFRIAAIGDSFTNAPLMQFDDAYPKRLERILNLNETDAAMKAEVINFGRRGASTFREVGITRKALNYEPDLILLEITLNDPALPGYSKRVRQLFHHQLTVDARAHPVFRYWRSFAFALTRLYNAESHRRYISFHKDLFQDPDSWQRFANALAVIRQICNERRVPLVAVIFPFVHYPFDDTYPFLSVHTKIANYLDTIGVRHLDLFPAFAGISPERLVLSPHGDKHPNEIAHRIAAEHIYAWLENERFVPTPLILANRVRNRGLRHRAKRRIAHL